MPTFFCERCDETFVWPWKRKRCPTCWKTPGGNGVGMPTKACHLCGAGFLSRWPRKACFTCRPAQPQFDLAAFRERGLLPPEAGRCRVCAGKVPPGREYCDHRCRQRAYYIRYEGLAAQDWREIHGGEPPKRGRPRC